MKNDLDLWTQLITYFILGKDEGKVEGKVKVKDETLLTAAKRGLLKSLTLAIIADVHDVEESYLLDLLAREKAAISSLGGENQIA